jgi:hypothetical protein
VFSGIEKNPDTESVLKGSTVVNPVKIPREHMKKLLKCIYFGDELDF